jgi:hypothetical protein
MMNNITWIGWLGSAVVAIALTVGCEQPGSDRPATYKVTGKVTLDGDPVEGATVTFAPSGAGGTPAVGTTDGSGSYSLKSFGTEQGAVPGEYMVSVTKYAFDDAGGGGGGSDAGDKMPADYTGAAEQGEDSGGQNELPAKYSVAKDSGLTATVTENAGDNVFDFSLTSGGE